MFVIGVAVISLPPPPCMLAPYLGVPPPDPAAIGVCQVVAFMPQPGEVRHCDVSEVWMPSVG